MIKKYLILLWRFCKVLFIISVIDMSKYDEEKLDKYLDNVMRGIKNDK